MVVAPSHKVKLKKGKESKHFDRPGFFLEYAWIYFVVFWVALDRFCKIWISLQYVQNG